MSAADRPGGVFVRAALRAAASKHRAAREALDARDDAIREARDHGATWQEIADAVGLSVSAVRNAYAGDRQGARYLERKD